MALCGRPKKGESASAILQCEHCQKPYRRMLSRMHGGAMFCSHRCHSNSLNGRPVLTEDGYREHGLRSRGSTHPNWKGGRKRWAEMYKAWVARNRESIRHRSAIRRARLRGSEGTFTLPEWLAL